MLISDYQSASQGKRFHNEETENWEGGKFVFYRRRRMRLEKKEEDYLLQKDIIAKLDNKQTIKDHPLWKG